MKNSYEWIDKISAALFAAEDRRLNKRVEELNQKNSEIKKKVLFGFMHMGERFIPESCKAQSAANRRQNMVLPTLAFELLPEAADFMSDVAKVKSDKAQIKQVLFKLLYQVTNLQELRDCLPEVLVPLVPEVSGLSRHMQDPTYLIRSDWRAVRDYEKTLPKIEMYAMTRLIY